MSHFRATFACRAFADFVASDECAEMLSAALGGPQNSFDTYAAALASAVPLFWPHFDMPPDCLTGELKKPAAPAAAPKFQQALPPKVQRSVDRLMRDISLMHKADELIHDPFVMSTANLNGSCGTFDVKPAFHVQRPTIC